MGRQAGCSQSPWVDHWCKNPWFTPPSSLPPPTSPPPSSTWLEEVAVPPHHLHPFHQPHACHPRDIKHCLKRSNLIHMSIWSWFFYLKRPELESYETNLPKWNFSSTDMNSFILINEWYRWSKSYHDHTWDSVWFTILPDMITHHLACYLVNDILSKWPHECAWPGIRKDRYSLLPGWCNDVTQWYDINETRARRIRLAFQEEWYKWWENM